MAILDYLNRKVQQLNGSHKNGLEAGRLNDIADRKFGQMISAIQSWIPSDCSLEKLGLCKAVLAYQSDIGNASFQLEYQMKNMLLSRNYDLVIGSSFRPRLKSDEICKTEDFKVALTYEGTLRINRVMFLTNDDHEVAVRLQNVLNNALLTKRLAHLKPTLLVIESDCRQGIVRIRMESLQGSATWSVFPPAFQLIMPKRQYCLELLEVMMILSQVVQIVCEAEPVSHFC